MAVEDRFLMEEEFGAGGISGLDPLRNTATKHGERIRSSDASP